MLNVRLAALHCRQMSRAGWEVRSKILEQVIRCVLERRLGGLPIKNGNLNINSGHSGDINEWGRLDRGLCELESSCFLEEKQSHKASVNFGQMEYKTNVIVTPFFSRDSRNVCIYFNLPLFKQYSISQSKHISGCD